MWSCRNATSRTVSRTWTAYTCQQNLKQNTVDLGKSQADLRESQSEHVSKEAPTYARTTFWSYSNPTKPNVLREKGVRKERERKEENGGRKERGNLSSRPGACFFRCASKQWHTAQAVCVRASVWRGGRVIPLRQKQTFSSTSHTYTDAFVYLNAHSHELSYTHAHAHTHTHTHMHTLTHMHTHT